MEFSFFSMIAQASLVAKAVLALLVVMSIISWGLMIQKFFALSAANNKAIPLPSPKFAELPSRVGESTVPHSIRSAIN